MMSRPPTGNREPGTSKPLVSVCLASRNETIMLCMTVLSAIEALKAAAVEGEIVIVENSDADKHQAALDCLAGPIKEGRVRVIREEAPSIALAIHRAHEEAHGEFLFYTDAHTLIGAGTLEALLDFFARHDGERIGFVHAPIQWAHRSAATKRTHMCVTANKLGEWAGATAATTEQRVTWKGMPYMIRADVWRQIGGLGCCAEHKLGWGVLNYLGMKTWFMGFENWAIPSGVVYHFGEWPESVKRHAPKYRTYSTSGRHAGLARAVALYVFGGEETLRAEFAPSRLNRFFNGIEAALKSVREVAEAEREWMLQKQTVTFNDLFSDPPWQPDEFQTISTGYRDLNAALHADAGVKYGYKGHEQAEEVRRMMSGYKCADVLDYGAGKQTLSTELQRHGITARDYDPSIPSIASPPAPADLVVCSDVLEHVEPAFLPGVLRHLRTLARKALFLRVCTVTCTSKQLPDGTNTHRIVRDQSWWETQLTPLFDIKQTLAADSQYFTLLCLPS